jgi:hypothetical protein
MTEQDSNEGASTSKKYQTSGAFKKSKDDKSKEKKVLGDLEVFRDLIFKKANPSKTNDAAEKFIRTREKLAEYVRGEFDSDMSYLIQFEEEIEFKEPQPPKPKKDTPVDEISMVKYKTEYTFYLNQMETYKKHKAGVFGVILGQCHLEVKDALYRDSKFADIAKNNDVIALLRKLRELSHDCSDSQEPVWSSVLVLRRLLLCHQQPKDTVMLYTQRFKSLAKVVESQWGAFYPIKLCNSTKADDIAKFKEKTLVMIYLHNACNQRYASLKESLNNNYISGKNNYPETLDAADILLSNYQDHTVKTLKSLAASYESNHEFTLAQKSAKQKDRDGKDDNKEEKKPSSRRGSKKGSSYYGDDDLTPWSAS